MKYSFLNLINFILVYACNNEYNYIKTNTKVSSYGGKDTFKLESTGLFRELDTEFVKATRNFSNINQFDFIDIYNTESKTENVCPTRCFELCNFWAHDMFDFEALQISLNRRQCAGFNYEIINNTFYTCQFVVGTNEFEPTCSRSIDPLSGFRDSYLRVECPEIREITPPSIPPLPPIAPSPSIEVTILQPEVLIPLIIGVIIILVLIIFLFRECTRERAESVNQVFNALTGRNSNRIVIDTNKSVSSSQAIRK